MGNIYHNTLSSNKKWTFKSQGLCFAEHRGQAHSFFEFSSWEESDLLKAMDEHPEFFKKEFKYKLVGSKEFIETISELMEDRDFDIEKCIERLGTFEVIYDSAGKKFKISSIQEKQNHNENSPLPFGINQGAGGYPSSATQTTGSSALHSSHAAHASQGAHTNVKKAEEKLKVLIVDDSATIRNLLQTILEKDAALQVIGSLDLPSKVEDFLKTNKPDVITLDIHMPEMDGVTLLRKINPLYQIPTIMISSLSQEDGPYVFDALELGAFDYIQKPSFSELSLVAPHILERVKLAGKLGLRRRQHHSGAQPQVNPSSKAPAISVPEKRIVSKATSVDNQDNFLITIGSSTGGTEALRVLFEQFPNKIPPVLCVQHIPPVFSKALADRLNSFFNFSVHEAQDGDPVLPNQVLIAPGGKQMGVKKVGNELRIYLNEDEPVNRHRPSVDYLFNSISKLTSLSNVIGVILTGMGADGAKGLKTLMDKGAHTLVQNEESCVVYGMPRVAAEMGAAKEVVHLKEMGSHIFNHISKQTKKKRAS